ncbi:MAG: PadR family transcriptional regulator [Nostocoides sp.]|mgnify:CR=1 FL=1|jgi:DNA-binding PadR family transcriptional regulator|uniref:PadR family transcriptional regulator n=1 Tax=Nostocoides sp. TaxID=1917966 RepID=UPI002B80F47B|nr:PadR family transcriptional regulator [Tetrasphaera sp.]
MALQEAILVSLTHGEASGYDLAKSFDVTVANYWSATAQQLYKELERMADAGLVSARVVEQQRRPNKRIYALTPAGRQALRDATTRPPKPTAIRDELLVQVEAIDYGDYDAVRAAIAERLAASQLKLGHYQRRRAALLAGQSEDDYLATAGRIGPYLTLARGIAFEEENIRWCRFALDATT